AEAGSGFSHASGGGTTMGAQPPRQVASSTGPAEFDRRPERTARRSGRGATRRHTGLAGWLVSWAERLRTATVLLSIVAVIGATGFQCEYKPTALPIKFTFDENGNVDVRVSHDVVTPIGVFSLSESVARPRNAPPGRTLLIIRHAIAGVLKDSWFQLRLAKDLLFSVDGASRIVEKDENVATLEVSGRATG